MFEKVKPLFSESDYVIGNMETTLAGEEAGYTKTFFSFNTPDSFGKALKDAGFDLVTTINNHTLDRGAEGIVRTMEVLDQIGLPYTGTTMPGKPREGAYYFERDGVRVAVIAYTYGINKRLTEEDAVAQNLNRLALFGNFVVDKISGKEYPTSWVDVLFPKMPRKSRTRSANSSKYPT